MTRPGVRLLLWLVLAGAVGAGMWWLWRSDAESQLATRAARVFDDRLASAVAEVGQIKATQAAYVAYGQNEAWWHAQTADRFAALRKDIGDLRGSARTPDAINALDTAFPAVDALEKTGEKVFALAREDERTAAATTVFRDGFDAADEVTARLDAARNSERTGGDNERQRQHDKQVQVAGALAGIVLLVGLLLVPGRRDSAEPEHEALTSTGDSPLESRDVPLILDELSIEGGAADSIRPPLSAPEPSVTVGAPGVDIGDAAPASLSSETDAAIPPRDRRKAPELRAAAELCGDFARLFDARELPSLLARAARLIDATGLIIWVADADGASIRPALAHGYPADTVLRLPAISRHADNPTAAAWRRMEVQTVQTKDMAPGAIVVPLVNASGCLGVMAAEVRHGREASETALALARIVAAQVATLVTVPRSQQAAPGETQSERAVG